MKRKGEILETGLMWFVSVKSLKVFSFLSSSSFKVDHISCMSHSHMHYSHISVVSSFRFLQLVIAHPAFSKDEDLQKFLKEENVSYDFESNHCWF